MSTRPARLALAFVISLIFGGVERGGPRCLQYGAFPVRSGIRLKERSMTYVWSRDGVLYGQSVTRPFSSDCSTSVSKPAGNLWGQVYIEKWNPFLGEYHPCASTCQHLMVQRQQNLKTCGLAVVGGESRPLPEQRKPSLKG